MREAAKTRPVYAFAGAATFFAVEGLQFVPVAVEGLPLNEWLARLPEGTVLAGATSYFAGPVDLTEVGHPNARPAGRAQNFESFAVVVDRAGETWTKDYRAVTLVVDQPTLGTPLPSFGGTLRATADERGARVELAEQTVVATPSGLALAAFWPDGTLMRALDFPDRGPWSVPYHGAVYRLAGETPCVTVTKDAWADVSPALSTGSAVATLLQKSTVVLETRFPRGAARGGRRRDSRGWRRSDAEPAARGRRRVAVGHRADSTRWTSNGVSPRPWIDRSAGGGSDQVGCRADHPAVRSPADAALSHNGAGVDVIRPNFENESYFGAGWSGVELAGTGRIRYANAHAAFLLPLEPGYFLSHHARSRRASRTARRRST